MIQVSDTTADYPKIIWYVSKNPLTEKEIDIYYKKYYDSFIEKQSYHSVDDAPENLHWLADKKAKEKIDKLTECSYILKKYGVAYSLEEEVEMKKEILKREDFVRWEV